MSPASLTTHLASSSNAQLRCDGVGFAYGPRTVLDDISLTLSPHDRLGIVGPNGTGKTTLLRLLCGELAPARGEISRTPVDATVGLLVQHIVPRTGEAVGDWMARRTGTAAIVDDLDAAAIALSHQSPGAAEHYDRALTRYVHTDAGAFDQRAETVLAELGATGVDLGRPVPTLSGGERSRVNLAATLLSTFDVLLLDEPTNDLDLDGLQLLETMIVDQQRAIAIVSHDRAFLERTVTAVFELDDHSHSGVRYNGGFAAWEADRRTARAHHEAAFADYTRKRSDLEDRARQQRDWARSGAARARKDTSERDRSIRAYRIETSENLAGKAKQSERALERLERTQKVDKPWEPWELRLDFGSAERSGSEVVTIRGAIVEQGSFSLGPIDVTVTSGERILLQGANGSGKSTLIRLILGDQPPLEGTVVIGPSVRIATMEQTRSAFVGAPSLLDGFTEASGLSVAEARSQLAKLRLDTERIRRPAADLSPGEHTRAALGLFAAVGTNLLVLDEPTNHLDLEAIEQLEAALDRYPHTILLVTHDRRLIENFRATRNWHLDRGQLDEGSPP